MSETRKSALGLAVAATLLVVGTALWLAHANAWDLGGRSPVLGYDAAQYAVAARELSEHGRLATNYALPVELSRHAQPPWPLALVQPGLLIAETVLFKIGSLGTPQGVSVAEAATRVERLALVFPMMSYFAAAILLALSAMQLLLKHAPHLSRGWQATAGLGVGLLFLLDPEAQHFATGGFTELPFVLGLVIAFATLAFGFASRRPFMFGLILGAAGLFRGNMLWLAPIFALAAAFADPERGRGMRFVRVLAGYAVVLAPWWIYKWVAFGTPAYDLSALSLWIGVEGRTWFSINHLPEPLITPSGWAAAAAILGKLQANIPKLLLDLATGMRPLWLGSILIWTAVARPTREMAALGFAVLGVLVASLLTTAISDPILRYMFPARILIEVGGLLALWQLIGRVPSSPGSRRALQTGVAVLALLFGGWLTLSVNSQARAAAERRGMPASSSIAQLSHQLDEIIPPGELVMSNLGPLLAWYSGRPVVHLALTPNDITACRRYVDFRHVILVFRNADVAWSTWGPVVERPAEAVKTEEWGIHDARVFATKDGFRVVWLELDPLAPELAGASANTSLPVATALRNTE